MHWNVPEVNLIASWLGVVLGIVSGMLLGMGFLNDNFLGGYGSVKRRLYRLAHISFFGLAFINFLFWLTVRLEGLSGSMILTASTAMLIGAATMPLFCILTASFRSARHGFAIPVLSLLLGSTIVLQQLFVK